MQGPPREEIAIAVRDVAKRYQVFDSERARLLHAMWPKPRPGTREVWALQDVSFEIARGESVAVIGRNGGGKSTLLEIVTGTLAPTRGEVRVNGRVSALLELGSGFNPEYTGRDNVILNGLLLGLPRSEILARFDEIARFAEIGDALERPVKTYSSGMMMRLAFAVQVLTDPEILIVDEALSVGDFFFQQKCLARIRALTARGVTLLFVSHDMGTVRDLCQRAIYLRAGRLQYSGETRLAIQHYLAEREAVPADIAPPGAVASAAADEWSAIRRDALWVSPEADPGPAHVVAVALHDEAGLPSSRFRLGTTLRLQVAYRSAPDAPTHVSVEVRNKYGQVVTSLGSSRLGLTPPAADNGAPLLFEMRLRLLLEAGNYSLTVYLGRLLNANSGEHLDATPPIGPIAVYWDYENERAPFLGMFGLPAEGEFRKAPEGGAA
jgi:lipopolysaccharide transport system ATP-binding protein